MKDRWMVAAVLLAAALGFTFAALSTSDAAEHLDRQVHSIHCSIVPGAGAATSAESGCMVAMMSPYSSMFRQSVWGGIPIALPAMGVFAFIAFWAAFLLVTGRHKDRAGIGFLLAATLLPLAVSVLMFVISIVSLSKICAVCAGIYLSSTIAFTFAIFAARSAVTAHSGAIAETVPVDAAGGAATPQKPELSKGSLGIAFLAGNVFVIVPILVYVNRLPDYSRFSEGCGRLERAEDAYAVMVPLGPQTRGPEVVEILDPLCPACKAFEERLAASDLAQGMRRKAILFPLDSTCNWMVEEAVHPGACTVSEAVLCARDKSDEVLAWAFAEQESIKEAARRSPAAAERLVRDRFPDLARCVGTPAVKTRLNRSLRWAVANRLPVLTPQLWVGGRKLCDEDVDLGMDFTLSRMLARAEGGRR
jgi:uncharacterized membrane protein